MNIPNHPVKTEIQFYGSGDLFPRNLMNTQDMSYSTNTFEHNSTQAEQQQVSARLYAPKSSRVQYAAPQKIIAHTDNNYVNKYNSGMYVAQDFKKNL